MYNNEALAEYNQVGTYASAAYADPHQLIMMLYDGAVNRLAKASFAYEHGSVSEVNKLVADVVSIIEGLRECLDENQGGELAANLGDLYIYMVKRLLRSRIEGAADDVFKEVSQLLQELREAWASIPVSERNKTSPSAG